MNPNKIHNKILPGKGIPLYNRIESLLRNKILSFQYEAGEKLPSEEELLRQFGVSKITVRNALGRLEADGFISRHRGKGTFVSEVFPVTKQFVVTGSIYDIVHYGQKYDQKTLDIQTVKVGKTRFPRSIKGFFNLSNEDEISWIRRLRLLKGIPIFYLENFLTTDNAKYLTVEELRQKPLLKILKEKIGLTISKGEMFIEALSAEADIAEILECQPFDPLIFLQSYYWFPSENPFEIVNMFMRAEYFKYKVTIDSKNFENI